MEEQKKISKEKKANTYEIKPLLVDKKHMHDFYEMILNDGYNIKIFDKKKDLGIYKYFLPDIKEYIFWTFELKNDAKFKKMNNEMKAAICNNYEATIFQKENNEIICFNTGIVFVMQDKIQINKKILELEYLKDIKNINIDSDKIYKMKVENSEELYLLVISIYKEIMLKKLCKDIENADLFAKTRKSFTEFANKIYFKKLTDNSRGIKMANELESDLEVEKLYLMVENKFDLLYRNNRLDNKDSMFRIIIILLLVLIIIGTINLGNWIG